MKKNQKLNSKREGKKTPRTPETPTNNSTSRSATFSTAIPVIILALLAFSAYANALYNGFVYDDMLQVERNTWITDIKYIPDIFTTNAWAFIDGQPTSNYYRPLMHLIFMANYYIFGMKPWGYHLINILFHMAATVTLFVLIRNLTEKQTPPGKRTYWPAALMASVIFALHPIHTEAVTWVSAVTEVSFAFLYILSLTMYIKDKSTRSTSYILSVVSFAIAILLKETALTLPIVLAAYDYAYHRREHHITHYVKKYMPYILIMAAYMALRTYSLGSFTPMKRHALTTTEYAINVFPLLAQYIGKLILPTNLSVWYTLHPIKSIMEPLGIAGLATVAALIFLFIKAFRKNRTMFVALTLFIVPLLPVLYIPALGLNTFTERYLYLPSAGYAIAIACIMLWAKDRAPLLAKGLTIALVATSALYAYATIGRNAIWKDSVTLWSDTVTKAPDSALVHNNLAEGLIAQGNNEAAITEFSKAIAIDPDYPEAHYNLALAYSNLDQFDRAIEEGLKATQLKPSFTDAHLALANAYGNARQMEKAIEQFQIVLSQKPNHADAHYNLALAYAIQKQTAKAMDEFKIASKLKPQDPNTHYNLALAYLSNKQQEDAIRELREVLRLRPNDKEAQAQLDRITKKQT